MSTTLLIGRWPAALRRAFSQAGEGPIVTSSKRRMVKRGHRSRSRTSTSKPGTPPESDGHAGPRRVGERRAGRGVDLARDAVDAEAVGPVRRDLELEHVGGDRQHVGQRRARHEVVVGRTMIPSWSVPIDSSSSARIMPSDSTPRSLARLSRVPSGITAPGRATATIWPAATLGAPQTIWVVSPSPSATVQTVSRSASGWRCASSTRPTTKCSSAVTPCV